eukprot:2945823-Amphidinium_carterae.1
MEKGSAVGTAGVRSASTGKTDSDEYVGEDKSPVPPTHQEIEEHNLTHLPYSDWCKHCVQGKNKSQHHQRGGLTKQSITQIDYAYLRSDNNNNHYATILTMCESITGLGYATVVPYKGVNTEAVKTIVRFIVENGLRSTMLQSDGENAIKDLQSEIARQIPNVKMQTSPQYSHQSQGV